VLSVVGLAEVLCPYYLFAYCGVGQLLADIELDIENTEFSPGVRRMQAIVAEEAPFDHGREQMKAPAAASQCASYLSGRTPPKPDARRRSLLV
jgi:hypothetical protein